MTAYLWLLKYVIPFIIGGVLFGGLAWKIREAQVVKLEGQVSIFKDAKAEQDKTIKALQDEITKGNKSCQERLASKDETIRRLQEIDNMGGYDASTGNNPLRDSLNGMYNHR